MLAFFPDRNPPALIALPIQIARLSFEAPATGERGGANGHIVSTKNVALKTAASGSNILMVF